MRRLMLLASCLATVVAGCGSEGPTPEAARAVIAGDWAGAAIAVPSPHWPARYAALADSTIQGEPRCGAADSARRIRCTFRVSKTDGGTSEVAATVRFDRNGVVDGWAIDEVR